MPIKTDDITIQLIETMKANLQEQWPTINDYAEQGAVSLAKDLTQIEKLFDEGEITDAEAHRLIKASKDNCQAVLLTAQGLSLIAVEKSINEAVKAVIDSPAFSISAGGGSRDH